MDRNEITKVQSKVSQSAFIAPQSVAKVDVQVPTVLHDVLDFNREAVEIGLGELGTRLRAFAAKIDFEHPDLSNLIPVEVAQCISQLLNLCNYAVSAKLFSTLPYLAKSVSKELKENFRGIDDPFRNCQFVRLLKSQEDRAKARTVKQVRTIDLHSAFRKPDWKNQVGSFGMYVRFSTLSKEEIERAERMISRYNQLGLKGFCDEITRSIEAFKPNRQEDYCGFHRMPMTAAALVLAKVHGFDFSGDRIHAVRKSVCNWSLEGTRSVAPNSYEYAPRAYPFHVLQDMASDFVKTLVQHLENFPDVSGKPAFDHYLVVVPGIHFVPFFKSTQVCYFGQDGAARSFKHADEATTTLDMELIKSQSIVPILLGERDGKCYFLSYFA